MKCNLETLTKDFKDPVLPILHCDLLSIDASLPWKPKQQQRRVNHNGQYWVFKELKDLLERKELTAKARQDGGPSSPNHEPENSLEFLSDELDYMKVPHFAIQGKLSKLGKDLSNLSAKGKEISDAVRVRATQGNKLASSK